MVSSSSEHSFSSYIFFFLSSELLVTRIIVLTRLSFVVDFFCFPFFRNHNLCTYAFKLLCSWTQIYFSKYFPTCTENGQLWRLIDHISSVGLYWVQVNSRPLCSGIVTCKHSMSLSLHFSLYHSNQINNQWQDSSLFLELISFQLLNC